jgi:hypothetical protein
MANLIAVRNAAGECVLIHAAVQSHPDGAKTAADVLSGSSHSKGNGAGFGDAKRGTHVVQEKSCELFHEGFLL